MLRFRLTVKRDPSRNNSLHTGSNIRGHASVVSEAELDNSPRPTAQPFFSAVHCAIGCRVLVTRAPRDPKADRNARVALSSEGGAICIAAHAVKAEQNEAALKI
jgi:hypothetical protein